MITLVKNKINKGDLLIYVDEFGNQKSVSPDNLLVKVGTIVVNEATNEKKVGTGIYKKLGVVLSEMENQIDELEKENSSFESKTKKHLKTIVKILELLIEQNELATMDINELKNLQEEIKNEK